MSGIAQKILAKKIRSAFGAADKKRDGEKTSPADVIRFDNIRYGEGKPEVWQLLDVYRPKTGATEVTVDTQLNVNTESSGALEKLPVIVNIHGGAWVYGGKEVYQFYCMSLAQRGFAVVNFSYRLAPEAKFPASLEDTEKVFNWIEANTEKYGFDLNNVFAVGDSAGAHILTLYASALTNKEYAANYSFISTEKKLKLRGLALNCGKYELSEGLENDKGAQLLLETLLSGKITKEKLEFLDASAHITGNFPPTFVMTSLGDSMKPQAPVINKALEAAGVKYEYHCYGTEEKPLWHVFHCDPQLPEAIICNDEECNFFKKLIE